MSGRRGWNLKSGTAERAAADAKIRERWLQRTGQLPPEPKENLEMRTEAEHQNRSWEFRRLRSEYWEKPVLVDGQLVARELPEELVLPWEEYTSVVDRERREYTDWQLEQRPYGTVLVGPNRLPELLSDDQATPD